MLNFSVFYIGSDFLNEMAFVTLPKFQLNICFYKGMGK
jgi:hypothetical protein